MKNRLITKTLLIESDDSFQVTFIKADSPVRHVLFAAGLGGSPLRHLGILQTFAAYGMSVIAPHFEKLASTLPTKAELLERSRRLAVAANALHVPGTPIAGVGHSIGTVLLLMHVGAEVSTLVGDRLIFKEKQNLDRLVLLAPPTAFFRHTGALASVNTPIQVWVGSKDTITPPAQAMFLKDALGEQTQTDLHIVDDAGHFTFMNELPPHITDTHPDRHAMLLSLGDEVSGFLLASRATADQKYSSHL